MERGGRLRLHNLRHTAPSHAVMSGENLPLVGRLSGESAGMDQGPCTAPCNAVARGLQGLFTGDSGIFSEEIRGRL